MSLGGFLPVCASCVVMVGVTLTTLRAQDQFTSLANFNPFAFAGPDQTVDANGGGRGHSLCYGLLGPRRGSAHLLLGRCDRVTSSKSSTAVASVSLSPGSYKLRAEPCRRPGRNEQRQRQRHRRQRIVAGVRFTSLANFNLVQGPNCICSDSGHQWLFLRDDAEWRGTLVRREPSIRWAQAGLSEEVRPPSCARHTFGFPADGLHPSARSGPSDGNFYGTTRAGGVFGKGTVFRLGSSDNFATLHAFNGSDGADASALIQANDGSFYGDRRQEAARTTRAPSSQMDVNGALTRCIISKRVQRC